LSFVRRQTRTIGLAPFPRTSAIGLHSHSRDAPMRTSPKDAGQSAFLGLYDVSAIRAWTCFPMAVNWVVLHRKSGNARREIESITTVDQQMPPTQSSHATQPEPPCFGRATASSTLFVRPGSTRLLWRCACQHPPCSKDVTQVT